MNDRLVHAERDGPVALIRLDRPEKFNAFDGSMAAAMESAFLDLLGSDARALVVTGEGAAFCSGGDLSYLDRCLAEERYDDAMELVRVGGRIVRAIRGAPMAVIAAVNGPAAGGGASLALACDLRFGCEKTRFGLVYTRIGLVPAWGATCFLPRLAGGSRSLELVWDGGTLSSERAERLGLLDRVYPVEDLLAETLHFARDVAAEPAEAAGELAAFIGRPTLAELEACLAWEETRFERLFRSDEVRVRIARAAEARIKE